LTNGGGPATQNGKGVVRWNATRHGISSPKPVVSGLENTEDWENHLEGIMENLSPVGQLEITLAGRVALLSWRLHRVTRYDTGAIANSQETIEGDIPDGDRFLSAIRHKGFESTHPEDIRLEAKYYEQVYSALRRFRSLRPHKILRGTDASSVVWGVLMEAKKASEEEIDVEVLDLPGVPEDGEKGVLDLPTQEHWHERMNTAGLANDTAVFRAALKGWERASLSSAPPKVLAAENDAKENRFLTQGVSGDSRGCHPR
jgi:hypothetical protein